MDETETVLQGVGGWGRRVFEAKKRGKKIMTKEQERGARIARVGDWRVVIWASDLLLVLLSARGVEFYAKPARAAAQGRMPGAAASSGYSVCGTALEAAEKGCISGETPEKHASGAKG